MSQTDKAGTSKTRNENANQSGGVIQQAGDNANQSVHIHLPNAAGKPDERSIAEADASLREALNEYAEKILGTLPTDLCELEAIVERQSTPEKFGAKGLIPSKTSNSTRVTVDELGATAKEKAAEEAKSKKFSNKAAIEDHVTRYGNIITLIGSAGIGKTTFAKQYFKHSRDIIRKHVRDAITAHDSSYLAFLYLKELDNDKVMSVLEFLTTSTRNPNLNWKCQAGLENQLLARISKSNNVYIVMDGMDECRFKDLDLDASVIGLYDSAKPVVILQNLLRGDILPNAHKLLASRPGAYHKLHPSCKPHFPVRVIGFNESSQDRYFRKIYPNQEDYEKIEKLLEQNPSANALCFIPIFAKTIAPYIMKYCGNDSSFTLTDVFTEFVVTRIRSDKLKHHLDIFRKLSNLALNGMLNDKFQFDNEELVQVGLDSAVLEDFLHMQIDMQVSSTDPDLEILEGDKVFFFIHLLWHEFFAALHLMFNTDLDTFSKQLQIMESDEWEMVLRFLFGLLNTEIHRKLKPIFKISSADVASKKSLLKYLITSLGSQLSTHYSFSSQLFKICSLAQESNDEGITRSLADSLPGEFRIKGGTIVPSEVSSLCHVLRATQRELVIIIGESYSPVAFTGNGLEMFMDTMALTNHKMELLNLSDTKLGSRGLSCLATSVSNINKLVLFHCEIAGSDLQPLTDAISRMDRPMDLLTLSHNKLGSRGLSCLATGVSNINQLVLVDCEIAGSDMQPLTDAISRMDRPMELLNLDGNKLGSRGLSCLATSVSNINQLRLDSCKIAGSDLQPLTDAISRMDRPMELLDLSHNELGSRGLSCLATRVSNINQLRLWRCEIAGSDLQPLTDAISRMDRPMELLDLSHNELGSRGLSCLATSVSNINKLKLWFCEIAGSDLQPLTDAISQMDRPMGELNLGYNKLGSQGLAFLRTCAHNVQVVGLFRCGIDYHDVDSLREQYERNESSDEENQSSHEVAE